MAGTQTCYSQPRACRQPSCCAAEAPAPASGAGTRLRACCDSRGSLLPKSIRPLPPLLAAAAAGRPLPPPLAALLPSDVNTVVPSAMLLIATATHRRRQPGAHPHGRSLRRTPTPQTSSPCWGSPVPGQGVWVFVFACGCAVCCVCSAAVCSAAMCSGRAQMRAQRRGQLPALDGAWPRRCCGHCCAARYRCCAAAGVSARAVGARCAAWRRCVAGRAQRCARALCAPAP